MQPPVISDSQPQAKILRDSGRDGKAYFNKAKERARRLEMGRALMSHALEQVRLPSKTLVTLETKTGDVAEPLYASLGCEVAGIIPDDAWDPNGQAKHSTTYMFQKL